MTHQVFISYSSWDKPAAEAVCRELEASGISYWIAARDLIPGSDTPTAIESAIEECQVFVLILSSRSEESLDVFREIEAASRRRKLIIPMRIEDFQPGQMLNYYIRNLHWLDAIHIPISEAASRLSKNILQTIQLLGNAAPAGLKPEQVEPTLSNKEARSSFGRLKGNHKYDVFISYRRETDSQTARLIRAELLQRRFRVFLDVDDLRPGHFDESIMENIRDTPAFIVILSPGSLERCSNPDDWLRKEIACALDSKRMIIPILMPRFQFPAEQQLPEELRSISVHHGVNYSHDFFDAMLEKIVGYLLN